MPLIFIGSAFRLRAVAEAQLSGESISGMPPAARNAWTCAVIQERTRMAGNRSAYIHADQGNGGTNRFAGDLRPGIGSKTDVMSLAQSAGIVLPVLSYSSPRFPQPSAKRSKTS